MINPHRLEASYRKFRNPATGGKEYAPAYEHRGRFFHARQSRYKRATEALFHARLFLAEWRGRYDQWLAISVQPEGTAE